MFLSETILDQDQHSLCSRGGSLENRFRFPLLVARKIKEKCGKRFIVEGSVDDIRPCLRCNKGHISCFKDPRISVCSVNPKIGMEHLLDQFN